MTPETVERTLVPLAAELIGTIRDFGPDDVAAVLARVPDGRHDALAVVLAAMVDPDQPPSKLLAWTEAGPVQSRDVDYEDKPRPRPRYSHPLPREHGSERGYYQHRRTKDMPPCDACKAGRSRARKARTEQREEAS